MSTEFHGVKIALIYKDKLIVCLRDEKPGLRWPGLWDLPGGGREGNESPFECVRREVEEEFCFTLTEDQIIWEKKYPAMHDPTVNAYFMAAHVTPEQFDSIQFGDEGQEWRMMGVQEYMNHEKTITYLHGRLNDYLQAKKAKE